MPAMVKKLGLVIVGLAILGGGSLVAQVGATGCYSAPLFVFGDNYGDAGNNNYLATTIRADSPPYGIDSPGGGRPTGRFSNYRNFPDYLSKVVGLPEPPSPYLSPRLNGERLCNGANFASGGVGILNDTGIQQGNIIRMTEQLQSFERYKRQLAAVAGGKDQAERLINKALFFIAVGTWDLVGNYFMRPFSARASQYTLEDFIAYLISEYRSYLRRLYQLGARRIVVLGVGRFGCWPAQLAVSPVDGECDPEMQNAASLFNSQLSQMTRELNDELGGVYFIAANTFMMASDFRNDPGAYGIVETKVACCGQGPYNGLGQCTPASNLCPNRDEYIYWSPTDLTDRAIGLIMQRILNGPPEVISPMNLNTMLAGH